MADPILAVPELLEALPFNLTDPMESPEGDGMAFGTYVKLGGGNVKLVPPYWSRLRDQRMAEFARTSDPLKIAINTFISKASNIPLRINPVDRSSELDIALAEEFTKILRVNSGLRRGFAGEWKKFLWDYLTTDNGAFMYVMGYGNALGPIVGKPVGLLHLSSHRCTRTSNPEYPVVYSHIDGKRYRIPHTRIIHMTNLPSPDPLLKGVGFCSTSLCLDASQELSDITVFHQEKLGSRPQRQILYAKTGATLDQMNGALRVIDEKLSSEGLSRFAKTGVLAPKLPGGKLELDVIDLASAPDGFDRQTVTLLDMATIAAAFGLDLRDLAYSFGISGQTRSDAEVQHNKGLGKGVAEVLTNFAEQLTDVFLPGDPNALEAKFDFIDDAQDEASAKIRTLRGQARNRDIMGGVVTPRVSRMQMVDEREITPDQFEEMELTDGRLVDGVSTDRLFSSTDPFFANLFQFSVEDPLDLQQNDPEEVLGDILQIEASIYVRYETETGKLRLRKYRQALAALIHLKNRYVTIQKELMTPLTNDAKIGDNEGESVSKLTPLQRLQKVTGQSTRKGMPQPNGGQNGNKANPT